MAGERVPGEAFLFAEGSRKWLLFGFRLLRHGLLGALLCAAAALANPSGVSLAQERPRRLVIGHVLLHGHARNGAADHVESQGRRQRLIGLASGRDPRRLWPGGQ